MAANLWSGLVTISCGCSPTLIFFLTSNDSGSMTHTEFEPLLTSKSSLEKDEDERMNEAKKAVRGLNLLVKLNLVP